MGLIYWSVRSSCRRGGKEKGRRRDGVKVVDGWYLILACTSKCMKIWCNIQVIIYPLLETFNFAVSCFKKWKYTEEIVSNCYPQFTLSNHEAAIDEFILKYYLCLRQWKINWWSNHSMIIYKFRIKEFVVKFRHSIK